MKIYTKTGDTGKTGVIGGWLDKDHPRVDAYGTVDELNSLVGMVIAGLDSKQYADMLKDLSEVQQHLFNCCSDLATTNTKLREYRITAELVEEIEKLIDRYDQETEDIEYFIVPGGTETAAALHVCRTVARRAERRIVTLFREAESTNKEVLRYLNRLSDLFFVMARACNTRAGVADVHYIRSKKVFKKENSKLSPEETFKAIAKEQEDWQDFDQTLLDGLEEDEIDTYKKGN